MGVAPPPFSLQWRVQSGVFACQFEYSHSIRACLFEDPQLPLSRGMSGALSLYVSLHRPVCRISKGGGLIWEKVQLNPRGGGAYLGGGKVDIFYYTLWSFWPKGGGGIARYINAKRL